MEDDEVELTQDLLTKRMRHLNVVLNQFWKRWSREYLLELRESHRHQAGTDGPVAVAAGDVVLVQEDKPQAFWKLAQVKELISGRDGKLRGAILAVSSEKGRTTILQRPIQLLYPLEIKGQIKQPTQLASNKPTLEHVERVPESETQIQVHDEQDPEPRRLKGTSTERPKRAAALKARERVKLWTREDKY